MASDIVVRILKELGKVDAYGDDHWAIWVAIEGIEEHNIILSKVDHDDLIAAVEKHTPYMLDVDEDGWNHLLDVSFKGFAELFAKFKAIPTK